MAHTEDMNEVLADEILDAVMWSLTETPETPSTIARKAKVTTHQAWAALRWLKRENMAVATRDDSLARFRERMAGEVTW